MSVETIRMIFILPTDDRLDNVVVGQTGVK
jgi:hypothetical protein